MRSGFIFSQELCPFQKNLEYLRTNGPINAHLISGPRISTEHTKPGHKLPRDFHFYIMKQVAQRATIAHLR